MVCYTYYPPKAERIENRESKVEKTGFRILGPRQRHAGISASLRGSALRFEVQVA
jgi:hypothetical protein